MGLFGGGERARERWFEKKQHLMEAALGPIQEGCLQMIVGPGPYGPNATYFFHQHNDGTGLATMELAPLKGKHASNSLYRKYEFVTFTPDKVGQHVGDLSDMSGDTAGGKLRAALAFIGAYAFGARLEPGNTLEFPADFGQSVGGRAFVFDAYMPEKFDRSFGLMLMMEIHREEMAWAMDNNGQALVEKLKTSGAYPYSDASRPAVV